MAEAGFTDVSLLQNLLVATRSTTLPKVRSVNIDVLDRHDIVVSPIDEAAATSATVSTDRRRRSVILYFCGDADARISFSRIIQRSPHLVLVVTESTSRGIRLAHSLRPDLIVVDDSVLDSDARAQITRLQASGTTAFVPVLVLSAEDGGHVRFVRAGASACLTKPLNISAVERTTTALLAFPTL